MDATVLKYLATTRWVKGDSRFRLLFKIPPVQYKWSYSYMYSHIKVGERSIVVTKLSYMDGI